MRFLTEKSGGKLFDLSGKTFLCGKDVNGDEDGKHHVLDTDHQSHAVGLEIIGDRFKDVPAGKDQTVYHVLEPVGVKVFVEALVGGKLGDDAVEEACGIFQINVHFGKQVHQASYQGGDQQIEKSYHDQKAGDVCKRQGKSPVRRLGFHLFENLEFIHLQDRIEHISKCRSENDRRQNLENGGEKS